MPERFVHLVKVTGNQPLAPVQNGGPLKINDSKMLNLWTTDPCFEIIRSLLVSVFDEVSKPKLSRVTAQYSACNPQNAIF